MTNPNPSPEQAALGFAADLARSTDRRRFLRWSGITLAVAAVAGCSSDGTSRALAPATAGGPSTVDGPAGPVVNLGAGDVGILNYAYALEQLEYAFYAQVIATPYAGMTAAEMAILDDLRKHELVHRNFFKEALGANSIGDLQVDFTSINFNQRASVLGAAKAFEDTGVSAYNGAGQLITNLDYLVLAGKIVSVEARHAAAIRDLLNPKSADFAGDDVIDANGLDLARKPAAVLPIVDPYVVNTIDASGLPTA